MGEMGFGIARDQIDKSAYEACKLDEKDEPDDGFVYGSIEPAEVTPVRSVGTEEGIETESFIKIGSKG